MKGTINEIWKCMRDAAFKCSADQEIGYKAAMQYLHFLISKSEHYNTYAEYKTDLIRIDKELTRTKIANVELKRENEKLRNNNLLLEEYINKPSFVKFFRDGFILVELEIMGYESHFHINATREQVDEFFEEACKRATPNTQPKQPSKYIRDTIIHFYRQKGFICK